MLRFRLPASPASMSAKICATLDENRGYWHRKPESQANNVRFPNADYNKQGDTQQDVAEEHAEQPQPGHPSRPLCREFFDQPGDNIEIRHGQKTSRKHSEKEPRSKDRAQKRKDRGRPPRVAPKAGHRDIRVEFQSTLSKAFTALRRLMKPAATPKRRPSSVNQGKVASFWSR